MSARPRGSPFGKSNATGRNSGKRKRTTKGFLTWVPMYRWEMDLPAYRLMSVYGRALLMEYRRKFNGSNNGEISMSAREAGILLCCDKDTAYKYQGELLEKGWIREVQKGSFNRKTDATGRKFRAATTWRLTNEPIGLGVDTPATKEYMKWKPKN